MLPTISTALSNLAADMMCMCDGGRVECLFAVTDGGVRKGGGRAQSCARSTLHAGPGPPLACPMARSLDLRVESCYSRSEAIVRAPRAPPSFLRRRSAVPCQSQACLARAGIPTSLPPAQLLCKRGIFAPLCRARRAAGVKRFYFQIVVLNHVKYIQACLRRSKARTWIYDGSYC